MKQSLIFRTGGLMLLVGLATGIAHASEAYLQLDVLTTGRVGGEMRISVDELAQPLHLDADADGDITWSELRPQQHAIENYLATTCNFTLDELAAVPRVSGLQYGAQGDIAQIAATVVLGSSTQTVEQIGIDCTGGAVDLDRHPRDVTVRWTEGRHTQVRLTARQPRALLEQQAAARDGFLDFVASGVWHIWIGYDHILFLIALLIPSVMQRRGNGREPASRLTPTLWRVAAIVTAFTLTHSITLSLAMTGWVALPVRLVETAIALSVAVAALYNLLPRTAGATGAWIAALFGLLHGFGFANVFDAVETGGQFWTALLGFNLGVELGQLAIVLAFVPLAFWLRRTGVYRIGVIYGGSTAVALLAMVWMVERLAG